MPATARSRRAAPAPRPTTVDPDGFTVHDHEEPQGRVPCVAPGAAHEWRVGTLRDVGAIMARSPLGQGWSTAPTRRYVCARCAHEIVVEPQRTRRREVNPGTPTRADFRALRARPITLQVVPLEDALRRVGAPWKRHSDREVARHHEQCRARRAFVAAVAADFGFLPTLPLLPDTTATPEC